VGRVLIDSLVSFRYFNYMTRFKIIVEKHPDGYVAYPLGLKGVVVGQGDTHEEALADVNSAIKFHLETFGPDALDSDSPVLEAFLTETAFPG
jgi:predicted RNase H-like HicB family nuclease